MSYVMSLFPLIDSSTEVMRSFTLCVFQAVLSAIVFVNLKGMFKQHSDVVTLWKSSKTDLVRGQTTPAGLNRDRCHYSSPSVLHSLCGSLLGCQPCSSTWIWVWRHRSLLLCLLSSSEPKREISGLVSELSQNVCIVCGSERRQCVSASVQTSISGRPTLFWETYPALSCTWTLRLTER